MSGGKSLETQVADPDLGNLIGFGSRLFCRIRVIWSDPYTGAFGFQKSSDLNPVFLRVEPNSAGSGSKIPEKSC